MGSFLVKNEAIIAIAKSITGNGFHEFIQISTKNTKSIEELYGVLKGLEVESKFDLI